MSTTFTHAIRLVSYRQHSEDRALVVELPDRLVVLVADGAGGIGHGGAAVDVVVGAARDHAEALVEVGRCIDLLARVDQIVMRTGGETTAVLLVIERWEGIEGRPSEPSHDAEEDTSSAPTKRGCGIVRGWLGNRLHESVRPISNRVTQVAIGFGRSGFS